MIIFLITLFIIILIFSGLDNLIGKRKIYYLRENYKEEYILPKVIYGYWNKPNDIIIAHLNTWIKNISPEWKINIITLDNVREFVDDDFMNKYKDLPAYRFSDFLRVYLLSKNGGVWMDAATIILNGSFLNQYYDEMIEYKYDTTLYEFKIHSKPGYPYLENWFLMSRKNSPFINDLYYEFNKSFEMDFLKYKIDILIPNIDLDTTLKNGIKTYHMQHAIIHYLLNTGNKYKLNIKDAEESMFKVQKLNNWDKDRVIDYIITNDDWTNYYSIKLVKFLRNGITHKNKNAFIKKLQSF